MRDSRVPDPVHHPQMPMKERTQFGEDPFDVLRPPLLYPFNSFFSSLRNRQSVPSARIFWGLDLIIPDSCIRSA